MTRAARYVVGLLLVAASSVAAQDTGAARGNAGPLRRPGRAARGIEQGAPNNRRALQGKVRQAFEGVVRRQLNLDAVQMQNLRRVDFKYEQQRRAVLRDERDARLSLRAAMSDSAASQQDTMIARYMDRLVQGQRKRAELLEAEQKELATILSPLQRAKYFALKERMNKKLQELQENAPNRGGPRPPQR